MQECKTKIILSAVGITALVGCIFFWKWNLARYFRPESAEFKACFKEHHYSANDKLDAEVNKDKERRDGDEYDRLMNIVKNNVQKDTDRKEIEKCLAGKAAKIIPNQGVPELIEQRCPELKKYFNDHAVADMSPKKIQNLIEARREEKTTVQTGDVTETHGVGYKYKIALGETSDTELMRKCVTEQVELNGNCTGNVKTFVSRDKRYRCKRSKAIKSAPYNLEEIKNAYCKSDYNEETQHKEILTKAEEGILNAELKTLVGQGTWFGGTPPDIKRREEYARKLLRCDQ